MCSIYTETEAQLPIIPHVPIFMFFFQDLLSYLSESLFLETKNLTNKPDKQIMQCKLWVHY